MSIRRCVDDHHAPSHGCQTGMSRRAGFAFPSWRSGKSALPSVVSSSVPFSGLISTGFFAVVASMETPRVLLSGFCLPSFLPVASAPKPNTAFNFGFHAGRSPRRGGCGGLRRAIA